jgi:hypothetical protein
MPRRSLTEAGPWLKIRFKIKITKRTHLSFFNLTVNTADFAHSSVEPPKNEPILAAPKAIVARAASLLYRRLPVGVGSISQPA